MISLVRVDNRLIHGQVVETWLPYLKVLRVAVMDDEAAGSPLVRAAMGLAVHRNVDVRIHPLREARPSSWLDDSERTLVLVREVGGALQAQQQGLLFKQLNLGNVHFTPGRRPVSPSVFLSRTEIDQLRTLVDLGIEVEARSVPSDRPISFAEIVERFEKKSGNRA